MTHFTNSIYKLFFRLLAEQAEKAATDGQVRLRQRDVELRNMEERAARQDERLLEFQAASDRDLNEIAR